jgi:hypothetical protein
MSWKSAESEKPDSGELVMISNGKNKVGHAQWNPETGEWEEKRWHWSPVAPEAFRRGVTPVEVQGIIYAKLKELGSCSQEDEPLLWDEIQNVGS